MDVSPSRRIRRIVIDKKGRELDEPVNQGVAVGPSSRKVRRTCKCQLTVCLSVFVGSHVPHVNQTKLDV